MSVDELNSSKVRAYMGQRVRLVALLGTAGIPVQIDVGFGDVVTPETKEIEYSALPGLPAPRIRAYTSETVIGEKLQAMVALAMQNSRMKGYFDLSMVSRQFSFESVVFATAVRAKFDRRRTDIPEAVPLGLSAESAADQHKTTR